MLWIEDIVESPSAPPFWNNSKVDMVGFVYPHKVVARSVVSTFWSAWNGVELEDGVKMRIFTSGRSFGFTRDP